MKTKHLFLLVLGGILFLEGCGNQVQYINTKDTGMQSNVNNNLSKTTNMDYVEKYDGAVIKTNYGDIKVKFYNQDSPVTVNNFLKLAD